MLALHYSVTICVSTSGFFALSIGLFNSIMFPVIFTLTLERAGARAEATSGLLCTAIVGGAVIPYFIGLLSGAVGYAAALILPAACYVLLFVFAIAAARTAPTQAAASATVH